MRKAFILFAVISVIVSCGGRRAKQADPADSGEASSVIPSEASSVIPSSEGAKESLPPVADADLTECARIMAGMEIPADSPRAKVMAGAAWKSHHAALDDLWKQCSKALGEVEALRASDLADIDARARTVFYTFGGPDFSYVAAFFPSADTLYLFGLEPAGKAICEKDFTAANFGIYRRALSTHLRKSYFITKSMKDDLSEEAVDGTVPMITVLMARMGYSISAIKADGPKAEISYFKEGDAKGKTLFYISTNLKDKHLEPDFVALMDGLDPATTASFVKSCSYCLHEDQYSKVRDGILAHSFAVVQDDSGIPYRFFDPAKWDVTLYGAYVHPLSAFGPDVYQKDLVKKYAEPGIKPLTFSIGYNKNSSLIVARRK